MTNQFALPIHIFIRPSPWLAGGIIVIHLGAMLALCVTDLHWLLNTLVTLVITASLVRELLIHVVQKHPDAPVQLLLTAESEWWLTTCSGRDISVQLMPAAFVHPLFTVLPFQGGDKRYSVILTPDVMDKDLFRRLRVRLRFQHGRGTQ